jgi:hypothetical protein
MNICCMLLQSHGWKISFIEAFDVEGLKGLPAPTAAVDFGSQIQHDVEENRQLEKNSLPEKGSVGAGFMCPNGVFNDNDDPTIETTVPVNGVVTAV